MHSKLLAGRRSGASNFLFWCWGISKRTLAPHAKFVSWLVSVLDGVSETLANNLTRFGPRVDSTHHRTLEPMLTLPRWRNTLPGIATRLRPVSSD